MGGKDVLVDPSPPEEVTGKPSNNTKKGETSSSQRRQKKAARQTEPSNRFSLLQEPDSSKGCSVTDGENLGEHGKDDEGTAGLEDITDNTSKGKFTGLRVDELDQKQGKLKTIQELRVELEAIMRNSMGDVSVFTKMGEGTHQDPPPK